MNKLIAFLALFSTLGAYAQLESDSNLEVAAFGGYRFGGSIDVFYNGDLGELKIRDNAVYGAEVSYKIRDRYFVSLLWTRQDSEMDFYGYGDFEIDQLGGLATEYFLLSGLSDLGPATGPIIPFAGAGVGLVVGTPDDPRLETSYRFGFTLQGGIKISLTESVGLKLRGAMLAPMQWGSGGLFCGSGSGCNVGVGASTTILQGEFSGGVVVKL